MTALELSVLFDTGQASPVEILQSSLERIQQLNPVLKAFCLVDESTAMHSARASEQRWHRREPLSALDGVPVAIKDLLMAKPWPTLRGSASIDTDQPWLEDAPVTARLREAGAVLVGKTTTSEFGCRSITPTRNPWNVELPAGGSSGGSAVAVAASITPIAIGTDYIGSVRYPAALCGVVGFKPSFGRVPNQSANLFNCSSVGPIARSVQDIALTMNAICKEDYRDVTALPPSDIDYFAQLQMPHQPLRVALVPNIGSQDHSDPEIVTALYGVADYLSNQGAVVTMEDFAIAYPYVLNQMWAVEALQIWQSIDQAKQPLVDRVFQRQAVLGMRYSKHIPDLVLQQKSLMLQMNKFMTSYDIILTTTTGMTADLPISDDFQHSSQSLSIFNLTGQPAVSIPVGLSSRGLPMAVQIAGAVFNDVLTLQVAMAVQKQFAMPLCPL